MKSIESYFEKAVRILCEYMPNDDELSKPTLFHSIRTGAYLYEKKYGQDIVLAGLLHDIIEDTEVTEQKIEDEFGKTVLEMILANSKDKTIKESADRIDELIKRCIIAGENALIVKAADVIDNFKYFTRTQNPKGIDYCIRNAKTILENKPDNFQDEIFKELSAELQRV